jgi:hypothetical protein
MIKQMALSISLISYRFLGLFTLMFFIQNCSKDPGPCGGQKTYYYLSEEDKAKVPYTGKDTLVFVSNTNDTAVCIGQGKKQFFTVEYDSGNPDCKPPEYYYEAYKNTFKSTPSKLNFEVTLYKKDKSGLEAIHFLNNNETEIDYKIYLIDIGNINVGNYKDSINIFGVWHKSVTISNGLGNPLNGAVFYNKKDGFLVISNSDSLKIWQLINSM